MFTRISLFTLFYDLYVCQRLDIYIDPKHKPRHVKALIRLSKASGLVPECLLLKGIEVDGGPVAAGGYGDVYKGKFQGQAIGLKVLKVYQKSDMEKLLKVIISHLRQLVSTETIG